MNFLQSARSSHEVEDLVQASEPASSELVTDWASRSQEQDEGQGSSLIKFWLLLHLFTFTAVCIIVLPARKGLGWILKPCRHFEAGGQAMVTTQSMGSDDRA